LEIGSEAALEIDSGTASETGLGSLWEIGRAIGLGTASETMLACLWTMVLEIESSETASGTLSGRLQGAMSVPTLVEASAQEAS
jgi:hypothetical protein